MSFKQEFNEEAPGNGAGIRVDVRQKKMGAGLTSRPRAGQLPDRDN